MAAVELPILYSFRRCPYAMRARMAILSSGVAVELREVVLKDKPAAMLEVSPKGTVPVLVLPDGTVIDESFDIMRWALGCADPARWLVPGEGTLGDMEQLIAACDGEFKYHLDRYKYASRYEGAVALEYRGQAELFLEELQKRLEGQPYLFGTKAALADYAIMPFIRQFANTDSNWFATTSYKAVQDWLAGLLVSKQFLDVMSKYGPWKESDVPLIFGKVR